MNIDYIKYSLQNLIHRKLRSWLTIISILVGIAAIFALISFGQGLRNYVDTLSSEMGTDKLMVMAGTGFGLDENFYLTKQDFDFLKKVKGVDEGGVMYTAGAQVEFEKKKKYVFGMGLPTEGGEKRLVEEMFTIDLLEGRALKKGDKLKVAMGYNYQIPNKIFPKAINLGDKIKINDKEVEVIGFYKELGNPQDDSQVYFTLEGFEEVFPSKKGKYQYIILKAAPGISSTELADKAKEKLRKFKGQDKGKEDFYIQSFEQAIQTFTTILNVINAILVLIALISLVVAAINITNTMYTSVLERTREIGVMKAIGAKNNDILFIFVFESGFLGMVGGILGIIFGYIVAKSGGAIAAANGYALLQPAFPIWLIIGCIVFAFLVGAGSGLLPARQASRLKPVDALRYE